MRSERPGREERGVRLDVRRGTTRLEHRRPHDAARDRRERQPAVGQVRMTARQSPRAVSTQRARDQRPAAVAATAGFRDHGSLRAGRAPAPWAGPVSRMGPRRVPAGRETVRRRSRAEPARSPRPESLARRCTWASPPHASSSRACSTSALLTRPRRPFPSPQRLRGTVRRQRTRRADLTPRSNRSRGR